MLLGIRIQVLISSSVGSNCKSVLLGASGQKASVHQAERTYETYILLPATCLLCSFGNDWTQLLALVTFCLLPVGCFSSYLPEGLWKAESTNPLWESDVDPLA
jgi:hypothetical protein